MKVAVTTSSFAEFSQEPLELLKQQGFELIFNPHGRALKPEEVVPLLNSCAGVLAGTEKYSRNTLLALPGLKIISRCGAGVDSVDLDAAKEFGISVKNTPDAPTEAVAELVVGFAFDLARGISRQDRAIRAGKWQKQMGGLVSALQVGIVGMGRIGRAVGAKLAALGAACAYFDPYVDNAPYPRMELDELLNWANLITLHVPGGTEPLLNRQRIQALRNGTFIINCSRGGVLDENALYENLVSGKLGGAALDVFEQEPYHGSLASLDNVTLTPHIGSYARQTRINMELEAARNLITGL